VNASASVDAIHGYSADPYDCTELRRLLGSLVPAAVVVLNPDRV
jgi:hypothetical protein